ncbi:sodium:proton antiporter, partial [Staphylococcus caprae]
SRSRKDFKSTKSQTQSKNDLVPENLRKLKLEGLYKQRTILDKLIQRNKITNDVATQIRENINYNEIVLSHELKE